MLPEVNIDVVQLQRQKELEPFNRLKKSEPIYLSADASPLF